MREATVRDVTVWTGGTVWTGEGDTGALAAAQGRIVAVGAEAEALAGKAAEVVDLDGGLLMPSFGDGHAHPLFGGLEFQGPPVRDLADPEQVAAAVGRWAAEHPGAEWIVGGSYDPAIAPRGEFDARVLDAAVPDRPVVLRAYDYHTVWVNSEALRRAGITADTPDPDGGTIVRRADGTPMGTLREWGAVDLVLDLIPAEAAGDRIRALADAGRRYLRSGITWYQDAWVDPETVGVYLEAARRGTLLTRADLALRADPEEWRDQLSLFPELRERVGAEPAAAELLTARTVKFFADGVIEGGTAALLEPYADCPHSRGMPVWPGAALAEAVAAFDRLGFEVHIHAIGDAGIRNALDALEETARTNPPRPRRPVIAHTQLVDPADLERFARVGAVANFEPYWAQLDPLQVDLTIPRLGEGRAALQYPMATLLRGGTRLSFGSDWPVSTERPLDGIQVAVTRRTFEGDPAEGWIPEERLTAEQALTAYTAGSAYQAGAEHRRGTLRVGADADLLWLDRDPRAVDPMKIAAITERGTWLAGRRAV
ncbi:amidohydrolase [Nocardiopsis composta]